MQHTVLSCVCAVLFTGPARAQEKPEPRSWRSYVIECLDTLIEHGEFSGARGESLDIFFLVRNVRQCLIELCHDFFRQRLQFDGRTGLLCDSGAKRPE